jgi:hypothetical protein
MLTKFTIFYPHAEPAQREVELPAEPTYQQLRALLVPLLGGALPERVNVWLRDERRDSDMFVDEIGAKKKLPVNEAATMIYWANTMEHQAKQPDASWPKVHGNAVLFLRRVWF